MNRFPAYALLVALATSCGGKGAPGGARVTDSASAAQSAPSRVAGPTGSPTLPTLPGDGKLEEPWRTRLRTWLAAAEKNTSYVEVLEVDGATAVLRRHIEAGGECREGPSRLTMVEGDVSTYELLHLGEDCCAGTVCKLDASSWNVRLLRAVSANDIASLAALVPAKGTLVWKSIWLAETGTLRTTTKRLLRKDVAIGKLAKAPSCDLLHDIVTCEPLVPAASGFTCRCDGGGHHIIYHWRSEGERFAVDRIEDESH